MGLSLVPSYHNHSRLDVVRRAHRYKDIMASEMELAITKGDLRMLLFVRIDAAWGRPQLQASRSGQTLRGSLDELTLVP